MGTMGITLHCASQTAFGKPFLVSLHFCVMRSHTYCLLPPVVEEEDDEEEEEEEEDDDEEEEEEEEDVVVVVVGQLSIEKDPVQLNVS